jgi:hypothetical protein
MGTTPAAKAAYLKIFCCAIANYPRTSENVQKLPILGVFSMKACVFAPYKRENSPIVAQYTTSAWGLCKQVGNEKAGRA